MNAKRIIYGLNTNIDLFSDRSPVEIGQILRDQGCDGVFLHRGALAWADDLRTGGLAVYVPLGVFVGQGIWEKFPGSRPIMANGQPAAIEAGWYEPGIPTLPELRQDRLEQLAALLQETTLDGVWLDAIRWPTYWETPQPNPYPSSFDPLTLAQFQADTGVNIPPILSAPAQKANWLLDQAAETWYGWRCQQIADFVAEAKALVQRYQPHALLGIFTVPWTEADFDQANIRIVAQDPNLLAPHVDAISPMVYHRMCNRDPDWVGQVTRWTGQFGRPVWPIIEAIDPPEAYPETEFQAACQSALQAEAEALLVFKLDGLFPYPDRLATWRNLK